MTGRSLAVPRAPIRWALCSTAWLRARCVLRARRCRSSLIVDAACDAHPQAEGPVKSRSAAAAKRDELLRAEVERANGHIEV
jgi:hypothetical protein